MTEEKNSNLLLKTLKEMMFPIGFVLLMWLFFAYENSIGFSYNIHGIYPRKIFGLKGVILAPLLHSDLGHLFSNTVPMLALSSIIFILYKRVAYGSFFLIYFLTGMMVWLMARPSMHIGASGVVYGLVAFIFWTGIFRKNRKAIVLSLVVLVAYSGYFIGIVPGKEGISWESHLLGGVAGIITSFLFKDLIEDDEKNINPWINQPLEEREYMFRRDLFDMTLEERRMQRAMSGGTNYEIHRQETPPKAQDNWDIEVTYEEL